MSNERLQSMMTIAIVAAIRVSAHDLRDWVH
jgi:hypothetical protein